MSMALPYGRVFVPSMLNDDVSRCLAPDTIIDDGRDWLMFYVRDVEAQAGLAVGTLPEPKSWNEVSAADDWPIGRLPAVLIIAGRSDADPERDGEGMHSEPVAFQVVMVTSARTYWEAAKDAGIYAMSARTAIAQRLLETDTVSNISGMHLGQFDPRPLSVRDPNRTDTIASCAFTCHAWIADSFTDTPLFAFEDRPENPGDPVGDAPLVDTVDIAVHP